MCEYNKRYKEMVYLLGELLIIVLSQCIISAFFLVIPVGRMGNQKAALELIIKKLEDVDMVSIVI